MSFASLIAVTFGMIGFCFAVMAFCAIAFPKTMCQKVLCCDEKHNVCIKTKNHTEPHMNTNGKEFYDVR